MLPYALRRLAAAVPVLLVVAVLTFGITYLIPGDPVQVLLGEDAAPDPERVAAIRAELNLDDPAPVRFVAWLSKVAVGDFGTSPFLNQSVGAEILSRGELTLTLAALSVLITMAIGLPLGILAAYKRGTRLDTVLGAGTSLGIAIPSFLVGIILAYIFGAQLRWLPAAGYVPFENGIGESLKSLLLPSIALALAHIALIARLMRSQTADVLGGPYVRAARSRGLPGRQILFGHVVRNSLSASLSATGVILGAALSGSIVIEMVFGLPGLGQLTVSALQNRDFIVVQAVMLVATVLHILVTLIADLLIGVADPRVRT